MKNDYLGDFFEDLGLLRGAEGVDDLAEDERGDRLRQPIGHGRGRPHRHQSHIEAVREGEELEE